MHILFLSHYFPPEVNAPASRTWEHTRRWVKEPGVRVTVVTNHPNHPYGRIYPGHTNRWISRETMEGVEVVRVKTFPAANAGFGGRILNYLFFMIMAVIASFRVSKPDIVAATSPQFFCAVAGYVVSVLKQRPFVFELRDLWPEAIVSVDAMRPGLAIRMLEKIELRLYAKSARIIALTKSFRQNLKERGIEEDKIDIMRNGADLGLFSPRPFPEKLAARLGIRDKFVVSYIGTVGMAHAADGIVGAARKLSAHRDIVFLIVGEGAEKNRIRDMIEKEQLPNIRALPGVSKDRVPDYYAVSDLVLVTLKKKDLFKTVIPSKVSEIMAMAKPILCTVDGECREIVEQSCCGLFVEPENAGNMADAILALKNDKTCLDVMGKNGNDCVELNFDRESIAMEYLKILRRLNAGRTADSPALRFGTSPHRRFGQ